MTSDLYTRAFGAFAFPLLDRLNGTTIAPKLEQLLAWEALPREQIQRRQVEKLARTVEHAQRQSDFYRALWRERGDRRLRSAYAALDGLPILTKADLAEAEGAFPLPEFRGRVVTTHTSGSTGRRMTFHRSLEQDSWFWALRFRMWSWSGYRPGDPYLEINLNPRERWLKRLQDVFLRCTYLTYNADNLEAGRIVEALRLRRIRHLNGFSSSLFALARYMLDRGVSNPGVLGITSTGDTLYPSYRDTIETAFGGRVLDYYGAGGEGLHLASQCPQSGGAYHIHPENAVVEILDAEGPVPAGAPGRIVVTQLDNDAMPLIRYELGDVGVAAPGDATCACGRSLPLLERIEGRIPDLVVAPDGTFLLPHFFVVLFKNLDEITCYQIVQERHERIVARLVARNGADKAGAEERVREQVSAATRGRVHTDFEWVEDIPLSGLGKRRLIISHVSREAFVNPTATRLPMSA